MEKTWEDFCRTGKVTDYLKYVNSEKEQRCDKETYERTREDHSFCKRCKKTEQPAACWLKSLCIRRI